ncbi:MAG: EAL domain-containing protein [Acetobacteraceae bacterium]|nr:EAL domain-containing protein [Acetobacteraceae bacterium]
MPAASLPPDEVERLASLHSYRVLDTAAEAVFDEIVALAAQLTGSPIALVSLVDAERQWFKARVGLDATQTPRDLAFCAHAILEPDRPLIVPDARTDARFAANPLVTGTPDIRAYLGWPLVNQDGHALGTLCVIDRVPRNFDPLAIGAIQTLARAVTANLELRRSLQTLRHAALCDTLTGLLNRRALQDGLAAALRRGLPVTAITIDLDHFKEVNDAEGHAAGDALLCAVAQRLRASVRASDLVARLGGDEFAVVLLDLADPVRGEEIAARLCRALHEPVAFGGKLLRMGATIGVAIAPTDAAEPELLLRVADDALLRAKRLGRGRIGRADREDGARLNRVATIVRAVDDVLAGVAGAAPEGTGAEAPAGVGALGVAFQPILPLAGAGATGQHPEALEALARWNHPRTGAVAPDELLALVGPQRAARLCDQVRQRALAAFAALRHDGMIRARLALNLAPSEVVSGDIALRIAEQVEAAGLALDAIEIEITEEVLLDRVSSRTLDNLAALRGRGAHLILDDFGTGNSGLSQLLRLPLDAIKLDKRFVQKLGVDSRAEEIVRASISLSRGLNLRVVAEGVETQRQATMLRALGCDAVQGYLFARPMSAPVLDTWLRDWGTVAAA